MSDQSNPGKRLAMIASRRILVRVMFSQTIRGQTSNSYFEALYFDVFALERLSSKDRKVISKRAITNGAENLH